MGNRSVQDLLADRRANVMEAATATDGVTRAMLLAHVDLIDAELRQRRAEREASRAAARAPLTSVRAY